MSRVFVLCVAALAFASQVFALNITIGGSFGNVTASQLLAVPQGPWIDDCQSSCTQVNTTIIGCGDSNDACLCTSDIAKQLEGCEQCMFNTLVSENIKAPDVRVGTNVGLSAYIAGCNDTSLPAIALTIAPNWDGPTDIILNTPSTVVVVGFGAILGGSALWMFANL